LHPIDSLTHRVFLTNPSTKTYGEYRKTLKAIYGKASQVVECKVIYSVAAPRRPKAKTKTL